RASSLLSLSSHVTAPPAIHTLSLHDALPILCRGNRSRRVRIPHRHGQERCREVRCRLVRSIRGPLRSPHPCPRHSGRPSARRGRSEEHTSELQSRFDLVCRLLLEKKNTITTR